MAILMRNTETGETAQAHRLGTTDDGRDLYQHVEGWELVSDDRFDPDTESERDSDGNWIVSN
jgi:hypothetical protein